MRRMWLGREIVMVGLPPLVTQPAETSKKFAAAGGGGLFKKY